MLDKIRLHAAENLPADFQKNLGIGFDGRCCNFLRVKYADLVARTLAGGTDDEILVWAHEHGGPRTDEECEIWCGFMMKRGWRDSGRDILLRRIVESNLTAKPIETMFDYIEYDEERDPAATRPWLS